MLELESQTGAQKNPDDLSEQFNLEQAIEDYSKLWLEWHVVQDSQDQAGILSFDFNLVSKEFDSRQSYKVSIPVQALFHLAEKYNWLQVLRGPKHRPQDPYELVQFIKLLDDSCS